MGSPFGRAGARRRKFAVSTRLNPRSGRVSSKRFCDAMPTVYGEVAAALVAVEASDAWTDATLALRFVVLSAARAAARCAARPRTRSHIGRVVWTVPAERMKADVGQRVLRAEGVASVAHGFWSRQHPRTRLTRAPASCSIGKIAVWGGLSNTIHRPALLHTITNPEHSELREMVPRSARSPNDGTRVSLDDLRDAKKLLSVVLIGLQPLTSPGRSGSQTNGQIGVCLDPVKNKVSTRQGSSGNRDRGATCTKPSQAWHPRLR